MDIPQYFRSGVNIIPLPVFFIFTTCSWSAHFNNGPALQLPQKEDLNNNKLNNKIQMQLELIFYRIKADQNYKPSPVS